MPKGQISPTKLLEYTLSTKAPYKCRFCEFECDSPNGVRIHHTRRHSPSADKWPASKRSPNQSPMLANGTHHRLGDLSVTPPENGTNGNGEHHTKKRWSEGERDCLHEQIMELLQADPAQGVSLPIVRKAMHLIIDQPRWRDIQGRQSALDVFERAEQAFRDVVTRGFNPLPPEIHNFPVQVKADVDAILRDVPLPKLAAVLAEREMSLRIASYEGRALPAPKPEAAVVAAGATPETIDALLPHICVVGFRPNQHSDMVDKFRGRPLIFLPSIDPSAIPIIDKLPLKLATHFIVDTTAAPGPLRDLIINAVPKDKREQCYGPNRVLDHLKDINAAFVGKSPEIAKAWLRKQVSGA